MQVKYRMGFKQITTAKYIGIHSADANTLKQCAKAHKALIKACKGEDVHDPQFISLTGKSAVYQCHNCKTLVIVPILSQLALPLF